MNYSAHYQQQGYDPSSQTQQFYDQPTKDYYSYSYSNLQYNNIQPYSYHNLIVQPSQHVEQEPNPPGITAPPPPQQGQNSYYQYHAHGAAAAVLTLGPQQVGVDAGVAVVHQPIVQSSYGGIGMINGLAPSEGAQTHLGPKPYVSGRPYRVRGRGRGRALRKHAAAPAQDQTIFIQGRSHIQGAPPQPIPQSYASSFGSISMPFQDPAHSAPVLPPPNLAWCELCRVDCNTLEILNQHKNGKKHKRKLKIFEELQNQNKRVIGRQMEQTSTSELKSEVPSQADQIEGSDNQQLQQESLPSQAINEESKVAVEKQRVEEVEPTEESGKKVRMDHSEGLGRGLKRKVTGGKGVRRMRHCDRSKRLVEPPKPKEVIPLVCELCNVKCESPVVFQSHLVGKKHQSKAKRFLGSHQGTLGQEVLQALRPATQTLHQKNANASTSIAFHLHQGFGAYQGASAQNAKTIDVQASTLETNVESAKVKAISQPQSLPANFGASIVVNAEGISQEGHSKSGVQSDCPTSSLVAAKMEGVDAGTEPVTSETTMDGDSVFEQSVVVPSSALVALP